MWSGTVTFALVSIPVDLYPAQISRSARFRTLDDEGNPLARRYFCPRHGRALDKDELMRGYPTGAGDDASFVEITEEELESVAPGKSRDIELERFVAREELEPLLFDRCYYLAPSGDSTKPYRLLAQVMQDTGTAGIATFVMRGHLYLAALVANDGLLEAQLLRFSNELRSPTDMGIGTDAEPDADRVAQMEQVIDEETEGGLEPGELQDEEYQALLELVDTKLEEGRDVVSAASVESADGESVESTVVDLMSALKRKLEASGSGRPSSPPAETADEEEAEPTKEDLYERAKELGVPGRSKMSKAQLRKAIEKAS